MSDPREAMIDQLFGAGPGIGGLIKSMKHDMLLIKALDTAASLQFGDGGWYVSAHIEITDGELITSVGPSPDSGGSPWEALQAYRMRLQEPDGRKHRIVTRALTGERREWAWNGAAWRELVPE